MGVSYSVHCACYDEFVCLCACACVCVCVCVHVCLHLYVGVLRGFVCVSLSLSLSLSICLSVCLCLSLYVCLSVDGPKLITEYVCEIFSYKSIPSSIFLSEKHSISPPPPLTRITPCSPIPRVSEYVCYSERVR